MSSATTDAPAATPPRRKTILDRLRGPLAILLVAAITIAASYYAFLQKKTEYYTDRDARLIARSAQQISRLVTISGFIVRNAAELQNPDDVRALYKVERQSSDEQRLPSKIFKVITTKKPDSLPPELSAKPWEHRYATRENNALQLNYEVLAGADQDKYVCGQIELQQLLKPLQRSLAGVFDTFFILDASGDVVYQAQKTAGDESGSDMKVIRLPDLTVTRPCKHP